jgi:hypothetical protein
VRLFFDTEFIEDGRTIELLSIGIVREDGAEYYAEPIEADRSRADPWVQENVLPYLKGPTLPREVIRQDILVFAGQQPEWWAYYADYDWVVLCQLFGRMVDLPPSWPMYCRDLKQLAWTLDLNKLVPPPEQEHHALADAKWAAAAWKAITGPPPDHRDASG